MKNRTYTFKTLFVCIVFLIFPFKTCFGNDFGFEYYYNLPFPVGGNSSNPSVQQVNSEFSDKRIEISYFYGEKQGMTFGIGYGKQERGFYYPKSRAENYSYNFGMKYTFLKSGYWLQIVDRLRLRGYANIGYGKIEFNDIRQNNTYTDEVLIADIGGKISYNLTFKEVKFDFTGGLGISKPFVKSFIYNNNNVGSKDFIPTPYLLFGIGIRH